jgi:hypothetical protein
MEKTLRFATSIAAALLLTASALDAQQVRPLEAGEMAPDFELVGSTKFGVLQEPVRLNDFRGKTVVLVFYVAAGVHS